MLYKGKVADEPNEWVVGELVGKDMIYQKVEPDNGCCGIGIFKVIPETIEEVEEWN